MGQFFDSKLIFSFFAINCCFSIVHGKSNGTQPPVTPINQDLYHTRVSLQEEIESLVHRHPDKLLIEKISSKNRGYGAEMTVVTYCQNRKESDDRSKFRILLIITCIPEFWTAW
ncbi:Histidine kinase 3 [Olea europaea subsp. europaea]|uniref:Histidine kinase 3 n=1 Tax=Olea europaea subsp. europaea TaxID=158383 RepID=A0A8S0T0R5_OLEEU|nr:Histidine kinase 3 [Olea europaea subsp. europaea]